MDQTPLDLNHFYAYIRRQHDTIPSGYDEKGLRVYRHLVMLGVSQMIEAHHPELRQQLGEAQWEALLTAFIAQSQWESHYYADVYAYFRDFLARLST